MQKSIFFKTTEFLPSEQILVLISDSPLDLYTLKCFYQSWINEDENLLHKNCQKSELTHLIYVFQI